MKTTEFKKIFWCCTLLALLALCGNAYTETGEELLANETKDPFAIVSVDHKDTILPKFLQKRDEDADQTPELSMAGIMLKFLRAENLELTVTNLLSDYGAMSIDPDTNTIIICDTKESLEKITAEIRKADQTPRQVLVEVVIIDVQLQDDTEIGVNWTKLLSGNDFDYTQSLDVASSGGILTFNNGSINSAVKALQKIRDTEILAAPRLLVVSGQTASLQTVEEIPYTELTQSDSGGGVDNAISSTEFKNAGIVLTVSPIITDDGKILIAIEPDQSINAGVAADFSQDVPIVDRRRISTKLLMEDGQIVVIGGLRKKDVRIIRDKVPLLGDLPIVGQLFSSDQEVVEHSELLIMISPHIYDGDIQLSQDERTRWKETKSLAPVRLKKQVRPESELIKAVVPQNKFEDIETSD